MTWADFWTAIPGVIVGALIYLWGYRSGRGRDVLGGKAYHDFACEGCGKRYTLWLNGGELDEQSCCGYTYSLEGGPVRFVRK